MARTSARPRRLAAALAAALVLLIGGTALALRAGQRAPEIDLEDLDGRRVSMASLRGRVVLVDFWASWCGPCAEEMPVLERLYQRYREQGLVVVGVSQDRARGNVRSFLSGHRVSFPIVHDPAHQVAGRYRPSRMPSSYLVDRQGVVRFVHEGFRAGDERAIERELRRLLSER